MAEKLADWTIAQMKATAPSAAKTMHQRVMVVCGQHSKLTATFQRTRASFAGQQHQIKAEAQDRQVLENSAPP